MSKETELALSLVESATFDLGSIDSDDDLPVRSSAPAGALSLGCTSGGSTSGQQPSKSSDWVSARALVQLSEQVQALEGELAAATAKVGSNAGMLKLQLASYKKRVVEVLRAKDKVIEEAAAANPALAEQLAKAQKATEGMEKAGPSLEFSLDTTPEALRGEVIRLQSELSARTAAERCVRIKARAARALAAEVGAAVANVRSSGFMEPSGPSALLASYERFTEAAAAAAQAAASAEEDFDFWAGRGGGGSGSSGSSTGTQASSELKAALAAATAALEKEKAAAAALQISLSKAQGEATRAKDEASALREKSVAMRASLDAQSAAHRHEAERNSLAASSQAEQERLQLEVERLNEELKEARAKPVSASSIVSTCSSARSCESVTGSGAAADGAIASATAGTLSSALEAARGEAAALRARLGVAEAGLRGTGERERESAQAAAAAAAAAAARARAEEERARAAEAAVAGAEARAAAAALAVSAAQEGAAAAAAERAQLQITVESLRREIAALTSASATSAAAAPAPHMGLEVPAISEAALLTPTGQPFLAALQATPDAHKLGEGNTGTVRSALWLRDGAPGGSVQVAVKTVLLDADVGTDDEASYRREAAVQSDLSHPHIAAVHGVLHSPVGARRALHTVMELGSGGGLDALVKPEGALHSGSATLPLGSPARLARVAHLGAQAALGLLQAHARGYAHCDVKLENLLLGSGGRVLVTDFGIAFRVRQGGRPLAPAGTLPGHREQLGTWKYLPPENFEPCPHTGQPPCDVYALAFALLELAQGGMVPAPSYLETIAVLPPPGSHLAALGIVCMGSSRRPHLPEAVDPRLATLIQACWAADPRDRPTMAEVARQLLDMAQ